MDIVIDTSALIAVIAAEPEKEKLIQMTSGAELIAPQSVHWEIGNALSAMLKRRRIVFSQAARAIEIYRKIPIRFVDVELEDTLEIVDELSIYAYDAYLIRCAIKYKAPLLTLDQGLAEAAKKMNVKLQEVER
jgi:predicted nucleic acid-binding protein